MRTAVAPLRERHPAGPALFLARYLLPVAAPPIENGGLLVREGRIAEVGKRDDLLADWPYAARVDFGDSVLLPPLVNAHTHLELTHFPRWAEKIGESGESASFIDWILRVIRVKRSLATDLYLPSLEEGIRLSLQAGTGTVGDILSFFPARRAYAAAPLRGRLFLETLGRDPARNHDLLRNIAQILDAGPIGRMQTGLAPHSPYTLSAPYLEEVFDFSRRRAAAVSIHAAEAQDEVEFMAHSAGPIAQILYPHVGWRDSLPPPAGRSPVAYLEDCGGLNPRTLLVHGVQVNDRDIDAVARSGAAVVLCPRSNARLGVGKPPLRRYREAGIPLALGTDSRASCDSLSVWDEISFARRLFAGEVEPADLLRMAIAGGAAVLGLGGETGALGHGYRADFQVLPVADKFPLGSIDEFLCAEGAHMSLTALYLDGREVLQMI